MVYFIINRLPRRWRFKAQRLWMLIRDFRDLFWIAPPRDIALQGLLTLTVVSVMVGFFAVFGRWLLALTALWTCSLWLLALLKAVGNLFKRGAQR